MPALLYLLWAVICIVVVLGLAYWFTRYVGTMGGLRLYGTGKSLDGMTVLQLKTLGKEQKLAVVQVGARYFLVGITSNNITLLSELSEEDAACPERPSVAADVSVSFRGVLDALRKNKGQEMNGNDRELD